MDLTEINKSPDSIDIKEAVLFRYKEEKDKLTLRFSLSGYDYDGVLLKDLYKNPRKNYLYLDLVFYGYKLTKTVQDDKFDFCGTQVLNVEAKHNRYNVSLIDADERVGNLAIKYKSFEWKYVGEYTSEDDNPEAFKTI